jgi:hypothetical protein
MNHTFRHIILVVALGLLLTATAAAQRISFGLTATDDIVLTPLNLGELNFNDKQTVILAGQTVSINLSDAAAAVLSIEGRADLDVTVTIDADPKLMLNSDNGIPLTLGFAYSNLGNSQAEGAKTQAVQVPVGFTSVTFPILRRASGAPAPPPTPDHDGYVAPKGTAFLFVYGTLGPVPAAAAAGLYTGNINIRVEYSTY